MGHRFRWIAVGGGAGLALAALCGCTSVVLDFHRLPPEDALRSIEAGVTTRGEVLRRLGPPEEMRQPAGFDRTRKTTPQHRRILEGGDVFGRDAYTYARGRQTLDSFGIFPVGAAFFRTTRERSVEERWRIEFGSDDIVSSVSYVDGIHADGIGDSP